MEQVIDNNIRGLAAGIARNGYLEGLRDGIRRFAWWKDGVQYVGTSGKTLKEALAEIDDK